MDNAVLIALIKVASTYLASAIIVLWTIPVINHIARTKGLLNAPGERTSHRYKTPNLAGIAIYFGACVSVLFFVYDYLEIFKIVFLASTIIFFIGLKDDIILVTPWKKLAVQIAVAVLIVMANLRFESAFGLFGVEQFSEVISVVVTIIFIVSIINAVNLIDGVDGLAASIGSLILGCFGLFFFINGLYSWSIYCAGFLGALAVFFLYNVFGLRNKTFMGDSGSLLLGLTIAVTTILFWETNANKDFSLTFINAPAITLAVIIIPVFDVVRVFAYRIVRRTSPFSADRNHLHHRLTDIGFTHFQTTMILTAFNTLMIVAALAFSLFLGTIWTAVVLVVLALFCVFWINRVYLRKKSTGGVKV